MVDGSFPRVKEGYAKEQAQDPNSTLPEEKQGDYPRYYEFPEWRCWVWSW